MISLSYETQHLKLNYLLKSFHIKLSFYPYRMMKDHLNVDDEIPGQQFVLLSVVLPQSLRERRELFIVEEFLRQVLANSELRDKHVKILMDTFQEFKEVYVEELTERFTAENDLQTNLSAVKIRGVFATMQDAKRKAQELVLKDPAFHVFAAEVGKWLPLFPNMETQIRRTGYTEEELNGLVGWHINQAKKSPSHENSTTERKNREESVVLQYFTQSRSATVC